ncbi:hypothetical protein [Anoxybacillus sp. J5B_2022]|uniref:hypothetical protein n=1 Tax=Anoxybacillus sp. J5B_2022 TaxID=3003246 RepID=UPI00228606AD|nr:hypothetical protein [Anoxybacillus sp. J5B_2022]MCZ0757039.1 hypothetical protein [Anoxybacillus sp. J5B_2022]
MRAYHFLDVETLELFTNGVTSVSTAQQLSIEQEDNEPKSEMRLTTLDFYRGFQKYVIVHERVKRKEGRAYGEDLLFTQYIESKSMNAYYNPQIKLLLIEGDKGGVNGFIKKFEKVFPNKFKVSRSQVDFQYVVEHSHNVWGGWISGFNNGTLRSVALFGDHVNLSEDYNRLEAAGKLSSLNCSLTFERKSYDFTITSNKTVVIMQTMTPEEDLDLLLHLKPILYKQLSHVM